MFFAIVELLVIHKEYPMKTNNNLAGFTLCAVALMIGVTVVILSVLKKIDPTMGVALLGIGMCCIGFSLLDAETPIKAVRKSRKK